MFYPGGISNLHCLRCFRTGFLTALLQIFTLHAMKGIVQFSFWLITDKTGDFLLIFEHFLSAFASKSNGFLTNEDNYSSTERMFFFSEPRLNKKFNYAFNNSSQTEYFQLLFCIFYSIISIRQSTILDKEFGFFKNFDIVLFY